MTLYISDLFVGVVGVRVSMFAHFLWFPNFVVRISLYWLKRSVLVKAITSHVLSLDFSVGSISDDSRASLSFL